MNPIREKFVSFRVSSNEKQGLEIMAAIENRSQSEMLRELIREGLKARGIDLVAREAVLKVSWFTMNRKNRHKK